MRLSTTEWMRRRSHLVHYAMKSQFALRIYSLHRLVSGVVEAGEPVEAALEDLRRLAIEVVQESDALVEGLPEAMSPKMVIYCSSQPSVMKEASVVAISEAADALWREAWQIGVLSRSTKAAMRSLEAAIVSLDNAFASAEGLREPKIAALESCQSAAQRLALCLVALPNQPGLCFPRAS